MRYCSLLEISYDELAEGTNFYLNTLNGRLRCVLSENTAGAVFRLAIVKAENYFQQGRNKAQVIQEV